ncbi:excalibur calcium-binding domain-containing protein [Saccharopolyspora aridisoli]|uniref:excalibur calcium-binding domain-containing protein n=1 Tax=Saccharopolyspora aridisoli TaxID=2530385 RepID=UPI0026C4CD77
MRKTATAFAVGLFAVVVSGCGGSSEVANSSSVEPHQMPSMVGQPLTQAKRAAQEKGILAVAHDASDGDVRPTVDMNWVVCFQVVTEQRSMDFGVVPSGAPCPARDGESIPWAKVPDVLRLKYLDATNKFREVGISSLTARGAYLDQQPPANPNEWIVCFQDPAAGIAVRSSMSGTLSVAAPGIECPQQPGINFNPPVDVPDPDLDRRYVPVPSANDSGSGTEDRSSDDGGSAYYSSCAAARAAGKSPLYAGDPGYRKGLDRDGDGTACE